MMSNNSGDDEWQELIDDASGATYYYNTRTGISSWEKPETQSTSTSDGTYHLQQQQQQEEQCNENSNAVIMMTLQEQQQQQQQQNEASMPAVITATANEQYENQQQQQQQQQQEQNEMLMTSPSTSTFEQHQHQPHVEQHQQPHQQHDANGHHQNDSQQQHVEEGLQSTTPVATTTTVHHDAPLLISCDWQELLDPSTGHVYYYNRTTLESTWIKPAEYEYYQQQLQKQQPGTSASGVALASSDTTPIEPTVDNSSTSSSNMTHVTTEQQPPIVQQQQQQSLYHHHNLSTLSDDANELNTLLSAASTTNTTTSNRRMSKRMSQRKSIARLHIRSSSSDEATTGAAVNGSVDLSTPNTPLFDRSMTLQHLSTSRQDMSSGGHHNRSASSTNSSGNTAQTGTRVDRVNNGNSNSDKRRSTILSTHGGSVHGRRGGSSNTLPSPNSRSSGAARRRPTSTAFLINQIPLKCTGKNTLVTYGQSKFQQHRKGLFRSVVPTNKMLLFTKEKLVQTLHEITREHHIAYCVLFFDLTQFYMLDRKYKDLSAQSKEHLMKSCKFTEQDSEKLGNNNFDADVKLAKVILNICLREVVIRNECMILLCKQCNGNPHPTHTVRGLQLLGLMLTAFPPTSGSLQEAICHFLQVLPLDPRATEEMKEFCGAAEKRLRRSVLTGPRKSLPSDTEFKNMTQHGKAGVEQHVFGVTIEEYMNWQNEHILDQANEHNNDPVILVVLSEALERLKGFETEGIFRLPGHTQQVERLRDELPMLKEIQGRKQMVMSDWVKDPHVCASVFKLWLRELADPIIPDENYQQAIDASQDIVGCLEIAKNLPDENRVILNFVIHFLSKFSEEHVVQKTKMTIENLAVVFAPNILRSKSTDPMTIMRNSNSEKQFVKTLVAANVDAARRGELDGM